MPADARHARRVPRRGRGTSAESVQAIPATGSRRESARSGAAASDGTLERQHGEVARRVDDDVVDRRGQRTDAVGEPPFGLPHVAQRHVDAGERGRAGHQLQVRTRPARRERRRPAVVRCSSSSKIDGCLSPGPTPTEIDAPMSASRSTSSTDRPRRARAVARLTAVVVLPQPPFGL